ncbi:MAG: peptidyl-alpha-hydroxyglycine alpha-amidating lyase family protein [SAR202 cluster bacterium]|jgi:DNA-binding beta-propeller fold protein YncE|nr:peptidyl-alpha-hydroxyglycine alpha-amidating lyase family protein [SAR202 cluster bacterium]MDP6302367.1 peptidyl-alpha-hydroxyglycine alpha-amidating lyase family protein [SAR202 cluster bacterium]MDP7104701.1 peptidyl-alpha-hydroxyglycine alpha-amidating lyase family protein [SAR202 cluster bacterium]MDP7226352.1 peptidyl-alpha-hydroxyglycine alpha-amidating lyase family protein [SAR202 cluster bacterium]MDP7414322.1 peptidyl-alpha-hydroxyglycine alpha-amidating lyase family protein [SAR2|tara:strand:+ start:2123 stop:3073 length:951 start_codon:yes stop_codon:yes gene_type:complete
MVSAVKLGSGQFSYEVIVDWEKLPDGYRWKEVAGVITDKKNNVYVFNRGDHPMMVFDSDGNFIKSWGEGVFTRAHGVTLGPDDTLYCTDDGDHTVRQCTLDGEVLMTIGVPGQPAGMFSGDPFNRCTHVALDPDNGDLFVSDGYGNSRVHKYSPDGKLIKSWGEPGTDAGQFNIAHNIATDRDGYVYVADRENHRIQVFDRNGNFETMWANVHRPCGIYISDDQRVYVGELGWGMAVNRELPNIGPRVSVLNTSGKVLARLGNGYGLEPGQFIAPHGICLAPDQSIYVGEVAHTNMSHTTTPPDNVRSFQKLEKVD